MKNKKRKIFLKIFLLVLSVFLIGVLSLGVYFFAVTKDSHLSTQALEKISGSKNISLLYNDGSEIDTSGYFSSMGSVDIESLNDYTINAFIATEDKRFYSHHGVDYVRMVGALLRNIKNMGFREGASTISQQLIKNTHLSNEKTLTRKLKEIKLATELEKHYSKEKILEMYLSSIYFGNGCYGIEKASHFYFDKPASELTLGESALLVATINAPTIYDISSKNEQAEKRKVLVLKNMLSLGYITEEEFQKNANSHEKVVKTASKQPNQHIKLILYELDRLTKINKNEALNNIIIQTSLDKKAQNEVEKTIENFSQNELLSNLSLSILVLDNKSKSVAALMSNSNFNMLSTLRQPASTIKPLLVYAPALEYGFLYPESIIVDEPINIGGYSPQNASKTFSGAVSVRDAVKRSLNIPAVKTLSNLGIKKAKSFASNLGIKFDDGDQNLALALGGMTNGVSLKTLVDAYSTFATNGRFQESSLISNVKTKGGKKIYNSYSNEKVAMSDSTAFLITDILRSCAKDGTAKRLNSLPFDVAAKTGTVGMKNSKNNTDAYCIAYTSEHTVLAHICSMNESGMPSNINGSNYPTEMVRNVLRGLYQDALPSDFEMPSSVVYRDIDTRALERNSVELASPQTPIMFRRQALFSSRHLPEITTMNEPAMVVLSAETSENKKPVLHFLSAQDNSYKIMRRNDEETKLLSIISGDGTMLDYVDETAAPNEIYEYYVVGFIESNPSKEKLSNSIKLLSY